LKGKEENGQFNVGVGPVGVGVDKYDGRKKSNGENRKDDIALRGIFIYTKRTRNHDGTKYEKTKLDAWFNMDALNNINSANHPYINASDLILYFNNYTNTSTLNFGYYDGGRKKDIQREYLIDYKDKDGVIRQMRLILNAKDGKATIKKDEPKKSN
jgi:hypothetical protein